MNEVIPRLLVCICLLLTYTLSAQTILNTSNSGNKYISCDGTYQDDGGSSIYASSYDTNDDDNPDFLCWTFCPTHPINEGVRLVFLEWDVVDPGDIFRIRDGKLGACDHVTAAGLSPLIGGNTHGFTGSAASGFDGSAGGTYAYGGGGWIESSPSNESGCLTVEFRPDGDGNKGTGFTIEVECIREEGPSDLFISEYYSDCDKNLYVELYNPTDAVIDLDEMDNEFTLRRQNGTNYGTGNYEVELDGKVQPHSTFVVCKRNSNSTITRSCDQSVDPFGNNGSLFPWIKCNEAFGLFQNGHLIDAVGDATIAASGSGLTVAGIPNVSKDYTLIRKKHITKGNYIWANSSGTTEANSEWLLVPNGNFKNIGKHVFGDQGIFISEFSGHDANEAYIEIHNRTNAVYDLSNMEVILAKNDQDWGATAPSGTPAYSGGWTQAGANAHMLSLQGSLFPGAVYVLCNSGSNPAIQCQADLVLTRSNSAGQSALQLMNGNDAIGLFMNHVLVDAVGIPGSNRAQTVDRNSSATDRYIIFRKTGIRVGNCDFADSSAGFGEWKLQDLEDYTLLGAHNRVAETCFQNVLISEYMNGYSTTAIGITNKSTSMIDLSQFSLKMASNGQGWGATNIDFPNNTMIAPNQEFVVYQAKEADPFTEVATNLKMKTTRFFKSDGSKYLNVDDAIGLYEKNGELLDIIGDQNSSNNGIGYKIAGVNNALSHNTLRRKSAIAFGNTEPMGSFGTWKNNSEWLVINNRNIENFGRTTLVDEIPSITYDLFVETGASCEGTATAKVNFELFGGTAPFTMQVDGQEVIESTIDLLNGSYTLTVIDGYGIRYNTPIEINAPLSSAITAIVQTLKAPSCVSSADASATIISEDVTLTYLWANGSTEATNNQLATGNHTVTVTNQLGCESILEVTIAAGPGLNASLQTMQAPSCSGNADGVASITSTETNLVYAWSNGVTTAANNQLAAGDHSVTVTNVAGCSQVLSVSMTTSAAITATASLTKGLSCANANDASASVTGGTDAYQYAWSNGSTTATVNNLGAGSHLVTVTNAAGCSQALAVNVEVPATIMATASVTRNLACTDASDASATVNITNGTSTYQYAWSNGSTTATVNNLTAGSHIVTVTNAAGCSQAFAVNVAAPTTITATASLITNLACTGANDASASVIASGGTGTYQYAWSNGSNTATVNNLAAGTHSVTVTDNNSCTTTSTITVAQPTEMSVQASITQPSCSQTTGSIQITPIGGTGPYQYNWNNAGFVQGQATLSNIVSGNYTVAIQDNNGCTYSESFVLETAATLEASIQNITPTTCTGSNNGQAQVVSNQTDAQIVWDNGILGNSNTQLSTGNHTVTIRNNSGCSQTIEFTIEDAPIINATINLTKDLSCHGEVGATATISAQGGSGKYEFYWSNGTIGTINNNLQAGTYTVTILDEVGCSISQTVLIEQPTALTLTANIEEPICSATPSGAIVVSPTGGVAPYQYNWNNSDFSSEASITGLTGGSHTVSIKDANGCTIARNFNLVSPANLEVAIDNITAPACSNSNNGKAQVSTSASDLSFLWSDGSTAAINNNLASGNHSVTVSNAAGCSEVLRVDIPAPTLMTVAVNNTQAATCTSTTGKASITVTGGQAPYTYLWDNGQTTSTGTSLTAGIHQVKVEDANGCSVDYELAIDAVTEVIETQIEALICNGTSYTTATNSYTKPGVYTEQSLTAAGCDSITTLILSVLENSSVDIGPDQIIRTGETIELFSSNTFESYHWSTGSTAASLVIRPEDLTVGANTLYLTITDDSGCEATDHIVIFYEQTTAIIDPIILKKISFYPNPSNGLLTVTDKNDELTETTIEAYTPQGQLVKSWQFDRLQTAQLDMQNLTNAVYILKIVRAEKVGFQKVLLNR